MKGVEEEFAIETAAEQYINRRQFSKFLVLTSLGMFVGNLWILVKSWLRRSPAYPARVIAGVNEIAVGDVKLFSYPEPADGCIMIRTGVNEIVAYSQKCPHLSCAVYYAREANRLECPCHEGYFSIVDGSVLQGPPPRALTRILLRQEGGRVIATGVKNDS